MSKYDSSDPLPYTQVDRAVKVTAMLLAQKLGVTFQHAMGSLVEFWQLNGDPRELERLLREGKREVVLDAEDIVARFELASGKQTEPDVLANLGLLEPRENGDYRVRGMSRYFAPIERRLQARDAASKGGKASAAARKERFGTSQPRSEVASDSAQAPAQADSKRSRSDSRSAPEADFEAAPKRRRSDAEAADSGQRTSSFKEAAAGADEDPRPSQMLDAWNAAASGRIPKARDSDDRRAKLKRWLEKYSLGEWRALCVRVNASPLLRGEKGEWKVTIDWVLKPSNLTKILDGNYDDGPGCAAAPVGDACSEPGCDRDGVKEFSEGRLVCQHHFDELYRAFLDAQRVPNPEAA